MRRRLVSSRAEAAELIASGDVTVGGAPALKASRLVHPAEQLGVISRRRFVSRGGHKLEAALATFGVDPAGKVVLDVGASTGGFTDCLLSHQAQRVVAIDVGRAQLHERLRANPKVTCLERTDVRGFVALASDHGAPYELVCADLSFISLRSVADALLELTRPDGELIVLVKPQFEVGRTEASKTRGVISDPKLWLAALESASASLEDGGAAMMGVMVSPLRGSDGNVEFFLHARRPAGEAPSGEREAWAKRLWETAQAGAPKQDREP